MYAVEFETDIKVPEYNKLKNKHAKVLFLLNDPHLEITEEEANATQLFKNFLIKRNNNPIKISKNINLTKLENEVNNDISCSFYSESGYRKTETIRLSYFKSI